MESSGHVMNVLAETAIHQADHHRDDLLELSADRTPSNKDPRGCPLSRFRIDGSEVLEL